MNFPFTKPLGIALDPVMRQGVVYKLSVPQDVIGKVRVWLARLFVWAAYHLLTKDVNAWIETR